MTKIHAHTHRHINKYLYTISLGRYANLVEDRRRDLDGELLKSPSHSFIDVVGFAHSNKDAPSKTIDGGGAG